MVQGHQTPYKSDPMNKHHNLLLEELLKYEAEGKFVVLRYNEQTVERQNELVDLIAEAIISKYQSNGVIYLKNSSFEYNGLKIYGTPHQPYFCGWAFNVPDLNKLINIYQMIPDDVDILLTHCPPYGILDQSHRPNYSNPTGEEHLGSTELKEVLAQKHNYNCMPKVVAFGHIHGDGGKQKKIGDTLYINASLCDEDYEPTNNIITIELP